MFDRNKPYNDLPDLPPKHTFFDIEVLKKWGTASRELGTLNKNILLIPNPDVLINTISLKEAMSSSAIENIFTTDDELYRAISQDPAEEIINPSTKEVLNYRTALWEGFSQLKHSGKLNHQTFITIFQKIKNSSQAYRSPQSQIVIRRGNSDLRPGEVIYTPPRGTDIIEHKIENLIDFLTIENDIDPLLKMAIGHYQFEAIHPFTDGNGRTGRIINLLYLTEQKLLSHPVLYLSRYIIENKDDYYHLLSGVTQRNDWKSWLIYMMDAVEKTSKITNNMIDAIIEQQRATYEYGSGHLKWFTKEFNELIFSQPYVKQRAIGKVLGISSRTTISKYADRLSELGILSIHREGKEVFYLNDDLLRILADK